MSNETFEIVLSIFYILAMFSFMVLYAIYKAKYECLKEKCKEYINLKDTNDKYMQLAVDFEKVNQEINNYKVMGGYKK